MKKKKLSLEFHRLLSMNYKDVSFSFFSSNAMFKQRAQTMASDSISIFTFVHFFVWCSLLLVINRSAPSFFYWKCETFKLHSIQNQTEPNYGNLKLSDNKTESLKYLLNHIMIWWLTKTPTLHCVRDRHRDQFKN